MGLLKQQEQERAERAMQWVCPNCVGAGILDHNDGENS